MQSITSTAMSAVDLFIMVKNLEDDYRMQKIFFCINILRNGNREDKQAEDSIINSGKLER
jgi:hypothetical protein